MNLKNLFIQYKFQLFLFVIVMLIIAGPPIRFFSEYLVHIMFSCFLLGLIFLIFNRNKLMLTCFAISGMLCVILKNESNTDLVSPQSNNSQKISISHYNLSNLDNPFELVASIHTEKSDIISFQELTPDWVQILNEIITEDYTYSTKLVRIDPFGKAIYSKFPIQSVDTINKTSYQDLKIHCSTKGKDFILYSSYINPPLDAISNKKAHVQLENLGNNIKEENAPTLAFGEYNMVYWSEEISKFRSVTGLNNSRKDIIPASFKLPYEHIFYSKTLECISEGSIYNNKNKKLGYKGTYQFKTMPEPEFQVKKK